MYAGSCANLSVATHIIIMLLCYLRSGFNGVGVMNTESGSSYCDVSLAGDTCVHSTDWSYNLTGLIVVTSDVDRASPGITCKKH
jgi:hypothetical protein